MEPTFYSGHDVVISRVAYLNKEPKVGDIVLFTNKDGVVMKRIVAVGGEEVNVQEHAVYVDGERRTLPVPIKIPTEYPKEFGFNQPYVVPEGYFYVIGDNLSFSTDSRQFGPIPRESIMGKAIKISFPINRMRRL